MNTFAHAMPSSMTLPAPVRAVGLQRKCGCGAHGGSCAKCRGNSHETVPWARPQPSAQGIEHENAARPAPAQARDGIHSNGSPIAHDFTRLPLNGSREIFDGNDDEEGLESVNAPPRAGTGGGAQLAPVARPIGTSVDTTTSFTQAALQAGFLSGMGIIARMQVLPDSTTWDGKELVESVEQTSSSCPDGLTRPGPCNGHSHFPIGGAMGGRGVRPAQPAVRNRFYDIHTSESQTVSFLHDPTRNPAGLNSCDTACRQDYSYAGFVIGSHSIRRHFHKGVHAGKGVTIVDVTKTDIPPGPGDFPARTLPAGEEYAGVAAPPTAGAAA